MNETRRRAMREVTSVAHRRLDEAIGQLLEPEHYRRYLRATVTFRRTMEEGLDWSAAGMEAPISTLKELLADCRDLDVVAPERRMPFDLPRSRSAWLGAAYVLEGSSLGSRVLLADVRGQLGLDANYGARHLAKLAEGGDWRGFLARLESSPQYEAVEAHEAALATFELAYKALDEVDVVASG